MFFQKEFDKRIYFLYSIFYFSLLTRKALADFAKKWNLQNTQLPNSKKSSAIVTGYLYHNYRGNGLELEEVAGEYSGETFRSTALRSTSRDIFKVMQILDLEEFKKDDYLQDDGFSYSVMKDPETSLTIIILSNRKHPVALEMTRSIFNLFQDKGYQLPLQRKPVLVDTSKYFEYSGTYTLNPDMSLFIENENDSLFVKICTNKINLIPQSQN